ncbi:MAG: hypothetical protein KGL39_12005 [Patescibacteria group bacterium]|nr:hypothetical protein [Patescibacteria group bacterium]
MQVIATLSIMREGSPSSTTIQANLPDDLNPSELLVQFTEAMEGIYKAQSAPGTKTGK